MDVWIAAAAAAVAAYLVKGLCGFANTLVFSSIMGFRANNIEITPVELMLGYPSNLLMAWRERKSLDKKIWLPLACFVIVGSIPGAFLLKNGNAAAIKALFGAVVIFAGVEMFFRELGGKRRDATPVMLSLIGLASGALCGLYGVGALLAAYVGRTARDTRAFRANLCAVFVIENTFRLVLYGFTGIITLENFKTALLLMPFMALGLGAGMLLGHKLDERRIKTVITVMLVLSGVSLLVGSMGKI